MKVVIMAGGKGTRIASMYRDIPKSMIKLRGKPIIQYQIEKFKYYGFNEFIFVIGYMGKQIINYFGDGAKFNVSIEYYIEKNRLVQQVLCFA